MKKWLWIAAALHLTACGGGGGGGGNTSCNTSVTAQTDNVVINWNANRETRVNQSGGGYILYYSGSNGFSPSDSGVTQVNVPYVSGSQAPTCTTLNLTTGLYYMRIAAYTAFPSTNTIGAPSEQISVNVP